MAKAKDPHAAAIAAAFGGVHNMTIQVNFNTQQAVNAIRQMADALEQAQHSMGHDEHVIDCPWCCERWLKDVDTNNAEARLRVIAASQSAT